jgi:hypothetical protein
MNRFLREKEADEMAEAGLTAIGEGDWVSGTTLNDERFIGYVVSIGDGEGVKVRVSQSDHGEIAGTLVETRRSKVRKLPEQKPSSPEELGDLIELALMTQDKAWFDELSAELAALSAKGAGKPRKREAPYPRHRSRYGAAPRKSLDF